MLCKVMYNRSCWPVSSLLLLLSRTSWPKKADGALIRAGVKEILSAGKRDPPGTRAISAGAKAAASTAARDGATRGGGLAPSTRKMT